MEKDKYLYMYLITAAICIVIVIITAAVLMFGNIFADEESGIIISSVSIPYAVSSEDISDESVEASEAETVIIKGYKEIAIQSSSLSEGDLIIVKNTEAAIAPDKSKLELVNIYDNRLKGIYKLSGSKLTLEKEALAALNRMLQAFHDSTGVTDIMVNDSYTELESLLSKKTLATNADLASGRAVRLTVFPSENGKMGEGVYLWIADHCQNYGYVLRYPSDKTEYTGAASSSAIYRYVGIPHAKFMKANNLCLDEYNELIKSYDYRNPLSYTDQDSGNTYLIYYAAAGSGVSTMISVPSELQYTVSGNNRDGFIITVSVGN